MRSSRGSDLNQRVLASSASSARSCETSRRCMSTLHYCTGSALWAERGRSRRRDSHKREGTVNARAPTMPRWWLWIFSCITTPPPGMTSIVRRLPRSSAMPTNEPPSEARTSTGRLVALPRHLLRLMDGQRGRAPSGRVAGVGNASESAVTVSDGNIGVASKAGVDPGLDFGAVLRPWRSRGRDAHGGMLSWKRDTRKFL